MKTLRLALLPLVLFILIIAGIGTFILYESLRNELSWERTIATVEQAATMCEVSYRPAIAKIVVGVVPCDRAGEVPLPADAQNAKITMGLFGVVTYSANGRPQRFEGMLKDAGIYASTVEPGQQLPLFYDPAVPTRTDMATYAGWKGFVLILAGSYGLIAAYVWFFWLRGRRPPGPPRRMIDPPARPAPRPAPGNRSFGRASRS